MPLFNEHKYLFYVSNHGKTAASWHPVAAQTRCEGWVCSIPWTVLSVRGWIDSVHANEPITLHALIFLPLNVQKSLTNVTGIESVLFIQLD